MTAAPTAAPTIADPAATPAPLAERRRWMAVLARAGAAELRAALAELDPTPGWLRLKGPEVGLIMLRGRMGGDGAPFNLMEATATRCTLRLDSGAMGHATILGRDPEKAELAALFDALLQDPARRPRLLERLIEPLARAQAAARQARARKAASTRVQFFTLAAMR
ncbi:MAG: phosphonate C-P lyase system protein PhnG [Rhodovarius sp.]|nr:phosphonate C-P lyase system protein PhnG [Rhodovarius sp.]